MASGEVITVAVLTSWRRFLSKWLAVLLALVIAASLSIAGTTSAGAGADGYDDSSQHSPLASAGRFDTPATIAEVAEIEASKAGPGRIHGTREWSASRRAGSGGTPTTPNSRSVATNNALRGADGRFATNPSSARSTASPGGSTHGNSLASDRPTTLYQLTDAETGAHLKWGITSEVNPASRYTQA
jgi:hypothetical protein